MREIVKKAVIFDMDGVIIDSEPVWEKAEDIFLKSLCGAKKYQIVKPNILGSTLDQIYGAIVNSGVDISREEFFFAYSKQAKMVYDSAKLTSGMQSLLLALRKSGISVGLVSASPKEWIDMVMEKLESSRDVFTTTISLSGQQAFMPKPAPDGYQEMIRQLAAKPKDTIVIEDSSKGITAGKKSGAYTICFTQHISKSMPKGADYYSSTIEDLKEHVQNYFGVSL